MESTSSGSSGQFDALHDAEPLCDLCQQFIVASRNYDKGIDITNCMTLSHHRTAIDSTNYLELSHCRTIQELTKSAKSCPFCRRILSFDSWDNYTSTYSSVPAVPPAEKEHGTAPGLSLRLDWIHEYDRRTVKSGIDECQITKNDKSYSVDIGIQGIFQVQSCQKH